MTLWRQVEWLQPYTDAKIRELGASGVKQLLAVPISFVSEHIETLEEIDMEYRELALESGVQVGRHLCRTGQNGVSWYQLLQDSGHASSLRHLGFSQLGTAISSFGPDMR